MHKNFVVLRFTHSKFSQSFFDVLFDVLGKLHPSTPIQGAEAFSRRFRSALAALPFTASAFGTSRTNSDLKPAKDIAAFKQEFTRAWKRSETYTLELFEQMTEEHLSFTYTPESFSYAFQFIHCIIFNANHVAVRLGVPNPYAKGTKKMG